MYDEETMLNAIADALAIAAGHLSVQESLEWRKRELANPDSKLQMALHECPVGRSVTSYGKGGSGEMTGCTSGYPSYTATAWGEWSIDHYGKFTYAASWEVARKTTMRKRRV